ncbi:SET domain-containing protein, partial [Lepidopterella palustris CBS 459.81]
SQSHFYYEDAAGKTNPVTQLSSSNTLTLPRQNNKLDFDPADWSSTSRPPGFSTWPPQSLSALLKATPADGANCVGRKCWEDDFCESRKLDCGHSFDEWIAPTRKWEDLFELKEVQGMGVGLFTKTPWDKGAILGWMAGSVLPINRSSAPGERSCYAVEIPIGRIAKKQTYAVIDAEKPGNWMRFANHDCEPKARFVLRRCGRMRIVTVEAIRRIRKGEEVTVDYGGQYWEVEGRLCGCGKRGCVSKGK